MKKLRIIYMGTPAFAVEGLQRLATSIHDIVGVVTAPDRPSGRGQKLMSSPVKIWAEAHNIPVWQPIRLRDESFVQKMKALDADLAIVVAFRMLPDVIWQLPHYGTINLHASLLPQYRGAAPINWAIINGENTTGVSTFFINHQIDSGAILLQRQIAISSQDDAGTLHNKLMVTGGELIIDTISRIAIGDISVTQQNTVNKSLKLAPKLDKTNRRIDWQQSASSIHNLIRGLSPYPTAWTELYQDKNILPIKIYQATPEIVIHEEIVGSIHLTKTAIKVAVSDGYIHIHKLQLPNKKAMMTAEYLNGYQFSKEARFE